MKHDLSQAQAMNNDELEQVVGGGGYQTGLSNGGGYTIKNPPPPPQSDNFLFGVDFNYPKGPFELPR